MKKRLNNKLSIRKDTVRTLTALSNVVGAIETFSCLLAEGCQGNGSLGCAGTSYIDCSCGCFTIAGQGGC